MSRAPRSQKPVAVVPIAERQASSASLVATLQSLLVRMPLVGPPAACPGAIIEETLPQMARLVAAGKFLLVHRSHVEKIVELLTEQATKPNSGASRR